MKLEQESKRQKCKPTQSKARFTPGPWEVYGATRIVKFGDPSAEIATVLGPGSGDRFAGSGKPLDPGDERWEEGCANAQLIAAAPEMYAALISIREWLLFTETLADPSKLYLEAFVKANNAANVAIAKTEGRTV